MVKCKTFYQLCGISSSNQSLYINLQENLLKSVHLRIFPTVFVVGKRLVLFNVKYV